MEQEELLKEALKELMQENDGVNPNSPIPIDQQLESKRAQYRRLLELKPFKARIEKAIEIIQGPLQQTLEQASFQALKDDLVQAANILEQSSEKQGKELGISENTLITLFEFAENRLKEAQFAEASAILTLLTVLDRSWFRHWFFLGVAHQELNEFQDAVAAYKNAVEIAGEDPLVHLFLAECYADMLDTQMALEEMEKAKILMQGLEINNEWQSRYDLLQARVK